MPYREKIPDEIFPLENVSCRALMVVVPFPIFPEPNRVSTEAVEEHVPVTE